MINYDTLDFSEFEKSNYEQWLTTAKESLKKTADEKRLFKKTSDNIELKPIFYQNDLENIKHLISTFPGLFPFLRHNNISGYLIKSWEILQCFNYENPDDFNDAALNALNNDQDSIKLLIESDKYSHNELKPLKIQNIEDLSKALFNIDLTSIPLYIDANGHSAEFLPLLKLFCDNNHFNSNEIIGGIYYDPIAHSLLSGRLSIEKSLQQSFGHLYNYISQNFRNFKFITLRADIYHNCGSNSSLELALALSTAVYYLRIFEELNIDLEKVIPKFILVLGISTEFFNQIAKIRAFRILWSKLTEEIGIPKELRKISIHSITSQTNKSLLDENSNILRSIIETYASVLGGADAITVLTFDYLKQLPNEFSDRVARNIQLVIKYESLVNRTIDPAGGSYLIEKLTYELAEKAWKIFKEIEKNGGIYKNIISGIIQEYISKIAEEKIIKAQSRKDSYIGVNVFANDSESIFIPEKETKVFNKKMKYSITDINAYNENIYSSLYEFYKKNYNFSDINEAIERSTEFLDIQKIYLTRFPKFFEELRIKAEILKINKNPLPKFLILNFGTIEQYMARRDFSIDFMHIGGFETEISTAFEPNIFGIEDAINFTINNGFKSIILCSSDDIYPIFVSKLVKDLKNRQTGTFILLAGYPENYIDEFKNSGVDDFIHIKTNAYTFLKSLQDKYSRL